MTHTHANAQGHRSIRWCWCVGAKMGHTASAMVGGFQVRYRIPGGDEHLDLFYRREPR